MNVLAPGAHFDDTDIGARRMLLALREQGARLAFFVATDSGYSDAHHTVTRSSDEAIEWFRTYNQFEKRTEYQI